MAGEQTQSGHKSALGALISGRRAQTFMVKPYLQADFAVLRVIDQIGG
jgi:hypothetical protein